MGFLLFGYADLAMKNTVYSFTQKKPTSFV